MNPAWTSRAGEVIERLAGKLNENHPQLLLPVVEFVMHHGESDEKQKHTFRFRNFHGALYFIEICT